MSAPDDAVVFALRSGGPASRAELATRLGVSRTQTGRLVADLARPGLVVDIQPRVDEPASVGRPGQAVGLRPGLGHAIGVNITHTEVRCLVTDLSHRWVTSSSDLLGSPADAAGSLDVVTGCVQRLRERVGVDHGPCLGVGLALPAPIDRRTARAAAVGGDDVWADVALREHLQQAWGVPVRVGNHGTLAATAERIWGAGRRVEDFIWLGLDTNVGGGICTGGRVLAGADGLAAELGHLVVDPGGAICRCGNQGCLQTVASLTALQRSLSPVHGPLDINAILDLLRADDPAVRRGVTNVAVAAGTVLAGLVNVLNPRLIIMGGLVGRLFGPIITDTVAAEIGRRALPVAARQVRVEFSRLIRPEPLGAAALVLTDPSRQLRLDDDRRPYWVAVDAPTGSSGSAIGPSSKGSPVS